MTESGPEVGRGSAPRRESLLLLPAVAIVLALLIVVWSARPRSAGPSWRPGEIFVREPIIVDVEESLGGAPGDPAFLRRQIAALCCLYGYPVIEDAAAAPWTLRVRASTTKRPPVTVAGTPIAYVYEMTVRVEVLGRAGGEPLEAFEVPEIRRQASEEARALRFTRLQASEIIGKRVFQEGRVLGNPDVHALLLELQYSPREGRFFNEVFKEIVDVGLRAVPDLILALDDTRSVVLPGEFEGLTEENRKDFLVCHFADWCLETILEIDSPLALWSDREHRARVKKAWYAAWGKRCGAYPCRAAEL